MTLARSTMQKCALAINAVYPQAQWSDETVDVYWGLLEDLDDEQVRVAVEAWLKEDHQFPPRPGEIRTRLSQLVDGHPDWDQVWREILDVVRAFGYMGPDGPLDPATLPWSSELVGSFVRQVGYREFGNVPIDQLRTFEAQCRNKYEAMRKRTDEDRMLTTIGGAVGMRRVDAAKGIGAIRRLGETSHV